MAANSTYDGSIWPNFKLIGAPMHNFLLATINEKDRLKKSREKVATPFPHLNPMGAVCCQGNLNSDPIWPKS